VRAVVEHASVDIVLQLAASVHKGSVELSTFLTLMDLNDGERHEQERHNENKKN
jgi:hypothetical protein